MINLLKRSKFLLCIIVFMNISSLVASQVPIMPKSAVQKQDVLQRLLNSDGTLSYDTVCSFIEGLENGSLDNDFSEEDWSKITKFIAFLSTQGVMPSATKAERLELDMAIKELLSPHENIINSSYTIDGYQMLPAIFYGHDEAIIRAGILSKFIHKAAKFVRHHKALVIVGAVLVVAAVAVTVTVVAASSAAAAAAASSAKSHQEEKSTLKTPFLMQ